MAYDLRNLRCIELAGALSWRRTRRRRGRPGTTPFSDQLDCRFQSTREISRTPMAVHVHVEHPRLVKEEMVVQGRDIESGIEQRRHDRIDFFLEEHQIAHEDLAAVRRLRQRYPPTEPKWRRRRHARDGHLDV